jgi:NitT/TauT family transport system ATP-binding protein
MFSIKVNNLSHQYNSLHVLEDIFFNVIKGQFVSIVGPSGCGKTTLLKILGGLIKPSIGLIRIDEGDLNIAIKKRKLGFVFQDPVMLPWRTVTGNITLPLEIIGQEDNIDEVQKLIKLVGLEGFDEYYPNALSGGMKQRLAIARVLVYHPEILLMDEPFGALDEITRGYLNLELLRIWQKTHKTIIFVTHSIPEAVFLSEKVIVLSNRPAKIICEKAIDLPYPREENLKQSIKYIKEVTWLQNQLKKSLK